MEMPYSLQTLPPEAVDILRYYAATGEDAAHADAIVEGADLTDRGFGKGIRRLVTKNYLVMSSDQVYRLTDHGRRIIAEVQAYERDAPEGDDQPSAHYVRRRLVLVAPRVLAPEQIAPIIVGFDDARDEENLHAPVNLLLRLSVTNGAAQGEREATLMLTNQQVQHTFEISAGRYTAVRVRVEVCQFQDEYDDFELCGGMYVDFPVSDDGGDPSLAAYGVDVILKEE